MGCEKSIKHTVVRLIRGDITDLDIEAFVFYATEDLKLGSGFGGAISVRGGPTIQEELKAYGKAATGDAVISKGGNLKARHIIHAVGPKFLEPDLEGKLRTTVLNTLRLADEKGIKRLAFPPMGAGFYGVPWEMSADVMIGTFESYLKGDTGVQEVVICVQDSRDERVFEKRLSAVGGQ